jgi:hypothetical protein
MIDALHLSLIQKLSGNHDPIDNEQKKHHETYRENSKKPFAFIGVDKF